MPKKKNNKSKRAAAHAIELPLPAPAYVPPPPVHHASFALTAVFAVVLIGMAAGGTLVALRAFKQPTPVPSSAEPSKAPSIAPREVNWPAVIGSIMLVFFLFYGAYKTFYAEKGLDTIKERSQNMLVQAQAMLTQPDPNLKPEPEREPEEEDKKKKKKKEKKKKGGNRYDRGGGIRKVLESGNPFSWPSRDEIAESQKVKKATEEFVERMSDDPRPREELEAMGREMITREAFLTDRLFRGASLYIILMILLGIVIVVVGVIAARNFGGRGGLDGGANSASVPP